MPHKDLQIRKDYAKRYRELNKEKHKIYQEEYRRNNDFSEYKAAWYQLKRFDKYGITKADFELMLINQDHSCDICNTGFSESIRPYIDHCHTSKQVRGLLCFHCNTGLGHFKDNPDVMAKAREYLLK